jgi:hypothetical protein
VQNSSSLWAEEQVRLAMRKLLQKVRSCSKVAHASANRRKETPMSQRHHSIHSHFTIKQMEVEKCIY